jgi:hypothetical protein
MDRIGAPNDMAGSRWLARAPTGSRLDKARPKQLDPAPRKARLGAFGIAHRSGKVAIAIDANRALNCGKQEEQGTRLDGQEL